MAAPAPAPTPSSIDRDEQRARDQVQAGHRLSEHAEIGLAMERGEVEGRAGNNFNSLKAETASGSAAARSS